MAKRSAETERRHRKLTSQPREVFSVRFSADEMETLRREAIARGVSLASVIRDLALGAMGQRTAVPIYESRTRSARSEMFVHLMGVTEPHTGT